MSCGAIYLLLQIFRGTCLSSCGFVSQSDFCHIFPDFANYLIFSWSFQVNMFPNFSQFSSFHKLSQVIRGCHKTSQAVTSWGLALNTLYSNCISIIRSESVFGFFFKRAFLFTIADPFKFKLLYLIPSKASYMSESIYNRLYNFGFLSKVSSVRKVG